jgi:NTE family protein
MKARFTIRLKRHIIVLVALMGALMTATAQDTIAVAQDTTSVVQDTIAAVRKAPQRKKVALVLSGGGAKGTAHIGVLKVLERAGIPIDIITGTSMGSLVGGIYACGHRANEIDSVVRQLDWSLLLSDRNDLKHQSLREREKQNTYVISKELTFGKTVKRRGGGFISGKNVVALIDAYTAPYHDSIDFNQLPIPFACVATDVVDYSEQVFHSGVIGQAMRASMSIPGVFAPVRVGDRVLVDGGLTNNFPTDIARQMGADIVIGVDVQSELKGASELTSASTILLQIVDHNCKHKYEENLALTDIHILVNTKGYSSASFSEAAVDTLIRRGEEAAMAHWDKFVKLREELEPWIQEADSNLGQGSPRDPVHVEFVGREKPQKTINVGARFDSEEAVALQANAELPIRAKVPMNAELTIRRYIPVVSFSPTCRMLSPATTSISTNMATGSIA